MRGYFITLEGVEGTGKSTHMEFVTQYIRDAGKIVLYTREPGGTPVGERIRELLLTNDLPQMNAETELMLMFAARIEHVNKVIQPALQAGTWVVSDRFYDASYAYQGYGRSVNLNRIDILRKFSIGDLEPDLTILLDATLDVSMQRVTERGNQDRFENEHSNFYEKVRRGYLQLAKQNQQRICVIDTNQSISLVQEAIKSKINRLTESK